MGQCGSSQKISPHYDDSGGQRDRLTTPPYMTQSTDSYGKRRHEEPQMFNSSGRLLNHSNSKGGGLTQFSRRTCTAAVQTDETTTATKEVQTFTDIEDIGQDYDDDLVSYHNHHSQSMSMGLSIEKKNPKKLQDSMTRKSYSLRNIKRSSELMEENDRMRVTDDDEMMGKKKKKRRPQRSDSTRFLFETRRSKSNGSSPTPSSSMGFEDDNDYYSKPDVKSSRASSRRYRQSRNSIDSRASVSASRTSISRASASASRSSISRGKQPIDDVRNSVTIVTNNENVQVVINHSSTSLARPRKSEPETGSDYDSDMRPLKERKASPVPFNQQSGIAARRQMNSPYLNTPETPGDGFSDRSISDYESASDSSSSVIPGIRKRRISFTSSVRTGINTDGTKTINEYVMIKKLGKGTYGKVQLCKNKLTNELFAIKIINRSLLSKVKRDTRGRPKKVTAVADILKEIAILKKVEHANIVRMYEVIDDPKNDKLFLVFEYVERGPVMKFITRDRTDRPAFTEELARKYFRDLICGLEYLHDNKIIHRDIKPENLLIDNSGTLKLTDFGVSNMLENDDDILYTSAGTPAFLPPEACTIGTYKGKPSDIWSAGVTLYVMVFAYIPFTGSGILGIYNSILHDEPQFPVQTNPHLVHLLRRLLDKNPDTRITIPEIKVHPWITDEGKLVFAEKSENAHPVTEEEIKKAITRGEALKMIDKFVLMSKMKAKLGARASRARRNVERLKYETSDNEAYGSDVNMSPMKSPRVLSVDINFSEHNRLQLSFSDGGSDSDQPKKVRRKFELMSDTESDRAIILQPKVYNSPGGSRNSPLLHTRKRKGSNAPSLLTDLARELRRENQGSTTPG